MRRSEKPASQKSQNIMKLIDSSKGLEVPKFGTFLKENIEKVIKIFMQTPCYSLYQDLRSKIK